MVMAGFMWLFKTCICFRSCLMVLVCSRLLWPVQDGRGVSGIVAVGAIRLLMVLYSV